MFYSDLVKKASEISFKAHIQDKDKSGYPYFMHPLYLASQMEDEITTCVALLHDVVEDHGDVYSFDYLISQGFYDEIIQALRMLTHDNSVDYMDYIKLVKTNAYATKVKIADLEHNMDTRRLNGMKTPKYNTYSIALEYLKNKETL